MADIKAIIVIMRLIKNTLYIFLEELKYYIIYIYFYLFLPPRGRRGGFKPRIRPPHPQRVVKGD